MSRMKVASVAVGLCLLWAGIVRAHVGTTIYPIYELPSASLPDLHDNTLEDWEDVLPGASLDHNAFAPLNVSDGAGINPADLAYRTFMAWNSVEQRFYFAIERVDDVYINTYEGGDLGSLWRYDSVEFMIDADHTGGQYNGFSTDEFSEEEIRLLNNSQAQQYFAIPESPDGRILGHLGPAVGWVTLPPWADAGGFAVGQAPTTSVIEMYVTPWDALNWQGPDLSVRSTLEANRIVGFQISVPDFDAEAGQYHGFHTLSGQANTWRLADNFVDGELVPCDVGDCGAPASLPVPLPLMVTFPNGGQQLKVGEFSNIYWYAEGSVTQVKIEYSTDNGATWQTIAASTENDGVYSWRVEGPTSSTVLVRISDAADGDPTDTSDGLFSIVVVPPKVSLVLPLPGGSISPDARLTVGFDRSMDSATLNTSTFLVNGSTSGAISGSVTYKPNSESATFFPDAPFAVGETVTLTVTGDAASEDGVGLDGDYDGVPEGSPVDDIEWSFTVEEPLMMSAYFSDAVPTLDGQMSPGEYDGTVPVYVELSRPDRAPGVVPDWIASPENPADLSFTAHALYTATDLFIAVDVRDEDIRNDSGQPWEDDDVGLYLDGDLVANDIGMNPGDAGPEGLHVFMDVGRDRGEYGIEYGGDWAAAPGIHDGGYVIEYRISLSSIDVEDGPETSQPGPGTMVGFNFSVSDDDNGGGAYEHPDDGFGAWSGRREGWLWNRESDWGRLYFSPDPAPPLAVVAPNGSEKWPGGTVRDIRWVADESIARVKIEYSTDLSASWSTAASVANTGTYSWRVPDVVTEEALVRVSDVANAGTFDVSDLPFAIREPFGPGFEDVWHRRDAAFPDEPVNIYARMHPTDGAIAAVEAEMRSGDTVVGAVELTDDGSAPDEEAGDGLFSGQWPGSSQLGYYRIDLTAEDVNGAGGRWNDVNGVSVAHTILRFPTPMLISPEQLDGARVPLLVDDDGSGYLTNGFLSAEFEVDMWRGEMSPQNQAISFTGTDVDGAEYMWEESSWFDGGGSWGLEGAMAGTTPLNVAGSADPHQEVFAYVDLGVSPENAGNLWFNISRIRFEEENSGVVNLCCSNLQLGRGDVNLDRAINSFDASMVLMHVVRKLNLDDGNDGKNDEFESDNGFTFPYFTYHLADVSGEWGISALDAALILQRATGLITHFPPEEGYYRLWEPPEGWWNPPTAAPAVKPVAEARPSLRRTVSLGDAEERGDGLLAVSVEIDEMAGVLAGSFALRYDAARLEPAGVRPAELTRDYLFADYAADGAVRVGFAGAEAKEGSGALAELLFRRLDAERIGELALAEVQLNEEDVEVQVADASVRLAAQRPERFALFQNFPNPFNPGTTIRYGLPEGGVVRLRVYNLAGQRIRTLVDSRQPAGAHRAEWDGRDDAGAAVASGVYLYRLETEQGTLVRKMLMVK